MLEYVSWAGGRRHGQGRQEDVAHLLIMSGWTIHDGRMVGHAVAW